MHEEENSKIRVLALFLSPFYKIRAWGGERAFIELIRHLEDKSSISILEKKPSLTKMELDKRSVKVFEIEARSQVEWIIKALLLMLRLKRSKLFNYDVIYAYNHFLPNIFLAYLASKIADKPFIVCIYHIERYQAKSFREGLSFALNFYQFNVRNALSVNLVWPMIHALLKRANAIIVSSESTTRDLVSLDIPRDKISVIYLGIEHEMPTRHLKEPPKVFDCLYMGRPTLNKGIFDILLAWKLVVKELPSARLALVGGDISRDLKNFIDKNKLESNVIFLGYLPDDELSETLYRSKLLVMPSHTEGFCLTIGKAVLHHVPVIAYDTSILREVYGFLSCVKFVREWDIRSLAKEIVNVLSNEVLLGKIEENRLNLLERYSWDATSEKVMNVLSAMR
ncbi:MAG: glycosyltransferase [archaeon]|nr:glycosyltransferase [archaeon]